MAGENFLFFLFFATLLDIYMKNVISSWQHMIGNTFVKCKEFCAFMMRTEAPCAFCIGLVALSLCMQRLL